MFTAEEARQKVAELKSNEIKEQSEMVEQKITEAVLNGESFVKLDFQACPRVVEWLRDLGYIVRLYKDSTSVTW